MILLSKVRQGFSGIELSRFLVRHVTALGITMADAADDAPPPPPKQTGGFTGLLINGLGIFVLTLVAVIVGGSINAKLHPLPDLQLDKEGKIKAIVPVAAAAHEEGGAGKATVYYAIDPP